MILDLSYTTGREHESSTRIINGMKKNRKRKRQAVTLDPILIKMKVHPRVGLGRVNFNALLLYLMLQTQEWQHHDFLVLCFGIHKCFLSIVA